MSVVGVIAQIVAEGGPFLYVIAALTAAGLGLAIERALAIESARSVREAELPDVVMGFVEAGEHKEARSLCQPQPGLLPQVLSDVLGGVPARYDAALENRLRERADHRVSLASSALEKRIDLLSTAANTTTMVGLLGTVVGLIQAFGPAMPGTSIMAVSRALYPTVCGIVAAIPLLLAQSILSARLDNLVGDAREAADRVITGVVGRMRSLESAERTRAAEMHELGRVRDLASASEIEDVARDVVEARAGTENDREVVHRHGSLLAR